MRSFIEYQEEGIVKTVSPDFSRAKSLIDESIKRKTFLEELEHKIKLTDLNANYFVEQCYDILIELIRAKMLKQGFRSSRQGAHEAEVAYLQILKFKEADINFMNTLRYFRNGIKYYGKSLNKEYAEKVISFMKRMYSELRT